MWKLGLWPLNSFSGNIFEFSSEVNSQDFCPNYVQEFGLRLRFFAAPYRTVQLKVVTNEKGEAVGEVVTIIC
jgi:hypothetical protein